MKATVHLFLVFSFFLVTLFPDTFYGQDTLVEDCIYKKNIKSVQLFREGWRLGYPVITAGSDVSLILKFDNLGDEIRNYTYKLIHCTHDWKPSNLSENEYIEGTFEDQIQDYQFSFNTYNNYVHYSLHLPNENMAMQLSGNYALVVCEDWNWSDVAFVKRFMVSERMINIEASVTRPVLTSYRDIGHQINLEINYGSFPADDPISDLKIVIMQNGRWDNTLTDLNPLFDKNNTLIFDNQTETIFLAGNEYRWFDIKSLRYQSPYIKSVDFSQNEYFVRLFPEKDRSAGVYMYEEDINGMFYTEVQEESNNDTDAEYVWVNFSFPVREPSLKGDYFIYGQLTNWELTNLNKMKYDETDSSYKLRLKLKQGYYNYHLVFREHGIQNISLADTEGNFYETENNYLILVYYEGTRSRYQRLIGYQVINSLIRN